MPSNAILCWPLLLGLGLAQTTVPRPPRSDAGISPVRGDAAYDRRSREEDRLLELVNQTRAQHGLGRLDRDPGLSRAAREHSGRMAESGALSHQFPDEADLGRRVAAESKLHLDQLAENVGYAGTVEEVESNFLNSPPHRRNLLNPDYNAVGLGIVASGNLLYVTEDFGHALPSYSGEGASAKVAASVSAARAAARLPALAPVADAAVQASACAMASADSLGASQARLSGGYIVRYTAAQLENLPAAAVEVIGRTSLRSVALGVCYRPTPSYPTGVYWIVLRFE